MNPDKIAPLVARSRSNRIGAKKMLRAGMACLGLWFLAVSPTWGQIFRYSGDSRGIWAMGHASSQSRDAQTLMPFDEMLTRGTSPESIGSAHQLSRLSQSEIYISGGTGDVLWLSPNGNAGAFSGAGISFSVDAPTLVRVRYELAIDTTSSQSWTGGGRLLIAGTNPPMLGFNASTDNPGGMDLFPAGAFEIGADGYARTFFDEILTFLPGPGYELQTSANSLCPSPTAMDICVGKPITFTTHLQVIPEPSTWLAALTAIAWLVYRRFRV
jgi:hypothetical protein